MHRVREHAVPLDGLVFPGRHIAVQRRLMHRGDLENTHPDATARAGLVISHQGGGLLCWSRELEERAMGSSHDTVRNLQACDPDWLEQIIVHQRSSPE